MKKTLLNLFGLLAISSFAQTAVYNFNSLNLGNLSGQDSWATTLTGTTTDIQVQSAFSHDGTNGIQFTKNGGNVNASYNRPMNNAFPGFAINDTSATYVLKADLRQEYWGTEFGIGFDANSDGKINSASSSTEKALRFKFSPTNNGGTVLYTLQGQTASFKQIGSGWTTIELTYHLGALNGQGQMTMRFKPVASSTWDTLFVDRAMGLVYANNDIKNPSTWNHIFGHFTGTGSGLDNISFTKMVTNATPTAVNLASDSVLENVSLGTLVSTLAAVDADVADTHTFSLVAGAGDADNGSFLISNDSLVTNTAINFEAKSSYNLRIRGEDQHGAGKEVQVVVYVIDELEIGIKEYEAIEINTYPNPAKATLNINTQSFAKGEVEIEVYNINGSMVRSINDLNITGDNLRLKVDDLSSGTYLLHMKDSDGNYYRSKIIKE